MYRFIIALHSVNYTLKGGIKMSTKYIKKAPVEKKHWQRRFLNAQEEILSEYAIDAYKSNGRGGILIYCRELMEYIVTGGNLPDDLYHYRDENLKQFFSGLDGGKYLEEYNNYDPEKIYYVGFARYTKPGVVRIWKRELKIVDEETWNKKFALLNFLTEQYAQNQEMCPDPKELH